MKRFIFLIVLSCSLITTKANEQCRMLREKYRYSLLGEGLDFSDKYVYSSILSLDKEIELYQSMIDNNFEYVFKDLELPIKGEETEKQGQGLNESYSRLRSIALGLMSPSSKFYYKENKYLLQWEIKALRKLGEYYNKEAFPVYYSDLDKDGVIMPNKWVDLNNDNKKQTDEIEVRRCNWWYMEIGIPRSLNDIIVLLYDYIPSKDRETYLEAIDQFIPSPNWTTGGAAGANGIWAVRNVALRAILADNPLPKDLNTSRYRYSVDKLTAAKDKAESLITIFNLESGLPKPYKEGYYVDGSCISHSRNSYTGGYGVGILNDNIQLLNLFEDSYYAISPEKKSIIFRWIDESIIPIFAYGSIMDYTRGREIARPHEAIGTGVSILSAILEFIPLVDETKQKYLKSFVKRELKHIEDFKGEDWLWAHLTPQTLSDAKKIMTDNSVVPIEHKRMNKVFPIMNRVVHHGTGFIAGVAAHSNRIFNYEGTQRENNRGWHTSDGMFYLYDGDSQHYNDGYWPTVNPYLLPGTTVEAATSVSSGGKVGRNSWCGGVTFSESYGTFGQQLMPYISPELSVNKSYFFVDDMIVFLGSGINDTDVSKDVLTVVENRTVSFDHGGSICVDGEMKTSIANNGETLIKNPKWIHMKTNKGGSQFGYYIPYKQNIIMNDSIYTGCWTDINTYHRSLPIDEIQRRYITLSVNHGVTPIDGTYAYAVYPGISLEQMKERMKKNDFSIIDNNDVVSAIETERIFMANFWKEGKLSNGKISTTAALSVIWEENDDIIKLVCTDPTQESDVVSITIEGEYKFLNVCSRIKSVSNNNGTTIINIDVKNLYGATVECVLKKV